MSTLKTKKIQLGSDVDPLKNFTLRIPDVADGCLLLSRGNADNPGSLILKVNPDGAILLPDGTAVGSQSMRNILLNACARVTQRSIPTIGNSLIQYGQVDRFFANLNATTVTAGSILQVTGALTVSTYAVGVYQATSTGTTAGGIGQRIEMLNTRGLNGKQLTVSGKIYHDFGASVNWAASLAKANSADNFSATTNIGSSPAIPVTSGTWTAFKHTFTLGSTDGNTGLQLFINFSGASAITGKSFYVGDLQLEVGTVATPFEFRDYSDELRRCQRYCYNPLFGNPDANPAIAPAFPESTMLLRTTIPFPVHMRDRPALSYSGGWALGYPGSVSVNTLATIINTHAAAFLTVVPSSGVTASQVYTLYRPNNTASLLFHAEL